MIPNQPSTQRTNIHIPQGRTSPDPNQSRKIKLAGVHSLKKSPNARINSPDTRPKVTQEHYQQLYFQGGLYTESDSRKSSLAYESVLDTLESTGSKAVEITGAKDLQNRGVFSGQKRCVVLTSTNEKSMRLVEAVTKKKSKNVDLVLLGELRPTGQYLNDRVVLVTSDAKHVIAFLRESGFEGPSLAAFTRRNSLEMQSMSSSNFRATMLNLMRESQDSSMQTITRRSHPAKERPIHHWLVDKDPVTNTFTTTEVSSQRAPQEITKMHKKQSQEGEQSQVKEYDQKQMRVTPVKKEGNQRSDMFSTWKQQSQKTQQISKPKQQPVDPPKKSPTQSSIETYHQMNPRAYRHFPSNIITEVSDEYKGSVRESIMNIEPDLSFKSTRQQFPSNLITPNIESQQENSKKTTSGLNYTSEYRKIENTVNGGQSAYNPAVQIRYGSSYNPQAKVYENKNYSNYQPAARIVIKKDVTSPQQINSNTNNTNIANTNNSSNTSLPTPIRQETSSTQLVSQQYVPSSYKAINSNMVSEVISSPSLSRQTYSSPIDQLRNITSPSTTPSQSQAYTSSSNRVAYTNSSGINWDDYEKIQSDGRTIYRKKVNLNNYPAQTSTQPVQNSKQMVEAKIVESQIKTQPIQMKNNNQPLPKSQKTQDQFQKNVKTSPSKKALIPTQPISSPKELMLQSTLKPATNSNNNNLSNPIPTVKVSAPLPLKQQSTKFTQLSSTKTPKKNDKFESKPKQPKTGPKPALLNESNMFSRMSQLHSDGSILRRNNIRFGVKVPQRQEKIIQQSLLQSKLSGIYKGPAAARKNTLNRVINGEEQLEEEKVRLGHVITRFNCFHFIIQEELGYISNTIQAHVATPNDRIQAFTGMEQLYERIRQERIEGRFDAGFIFARKQEAQLINHSLLPEDYYTVTIQRAEGEAQLEMDEAGRRIRMDQLGRLLLAQRMVIDSKLYQYVAYRSHRREIELLADRFLHTQFILQQVQTQFTSQILDFYYCQLPRLTRLYLLCEDEQLPQLVRLVSVYAQLNPSFLPESCKLICLIGDILKNQNLIMDHPGVTFISNPEQVRSYQDILRYAHHAEEDQRRSLPTDRLFCHRGLQGLQQQLQERFPGRFLVVPYGKLSEVYMKLDKLGKGKGTQKNYLILHDSLSHQRVSVQRFTRVFMVGKAKVMQPQVARVLNFEELLEVLGK